MRTLWVIVKFVVHWPICYYFLIRFTVRPSYVEIIFSVSRTEENSLNFCINRKLKLKKVVAMSVLRLETLIHFYVLNRRGYTICLVLQITDKLPFVTHRKFFFYIKEEINIFDLILSVYIKSYFTIQMLKNHSIKTFLLILSQLLFIKQINKN